jgi:PAS domain S-box-containing protein
MALSSTNSLYDNLNMLLDHMLQLDIIDSGAIFFADKNSNNIDLFICKGFSTKFEQYLKDTKKAIPVMKSAMSGFPSVTKSPDIISFGSDEVCSSENLGSILCYPIKYNDDVIAVMSVCSHSADEIPSQVITVVETIIAHMESVIICKKVESELKNLLVIGKLLSETSTHFIGMHPEKIDESINDTLKKIGGITGAEKVGVFMFSDGYSHVNGTHEWCAKGIKSDLAYFENFPIGVHSWWKKELFKGEPFYIPSIESLPSEAFLEKQVLKETNTKSLLVIPIEYHGKILGNLCLAFSNIENLSEGYLKILKLMGEVFANALEHKRKESEIKESESKCRRIFEEIHDIYFETQMDGTIITLSPSVKKHFGFEAEELIGFSMELLYTTPEERKSIMESLNASGYLDNYIVRLRNKSGNLVYLSANAHLIYGADGIPERIAGIARDVTEIKKIEKIRIEAKLLLENASNTRADFLSIINHELRTPLSHVMGFSDVLIEGNLGPLTPTQVKCVKSIRSGGSKLFDLLTSLNHIAEIEGGKMELEITEFSLILLFSDVQDITYSMAKKKNIKLKFNHNDLMNGTITCDRSKLQMILLNLISNAIKFTPRGGKVTVNLTQDTNQDFLISVKDTGIGISEEDQGALFKPFVQLESVLNRRHGGAGLGLALAKEFVELQSGKIWLTSEVGKGSTFEFMIPGNLKIKDDPN